MGKVLQLVTDDVVRLNRLVWKREANRQRNIILVKVFGCAENRVNNIFDLRYGYALSPVALDVNPNEI